MRFVGNHRQGMPKGMAYSLIDYSELVNCTGRCIREDKAGYIEQHHSPILACLGLDSEQWLTLTTALGSQHMLQQFKHHRPATYTRDGKGQSLTSTRLNS
jgi:hypothetical protein